MSCSRSLPWRRSSVRACSGVIPACSVKYSTSYLATGYRLRSGLSRFDLSSVMASLFPSKNPRTGGWLPLNFALLGNRICSPVLNTFMQDGATMPRFYFDVVDGTNIEQAQEPIECASLADVRYRAIDALPDLARDELPDGDRLHLAVRVRDEAGNFVFEAGLDFYSKWLSADSK